MTKPTSAPPVGGPALAPVPRMPTPEIYELEYAYFAWGMLLRSAAEHVAREAPAGAKVVDYMCGTGYLLGCIHARRPDLRLAGCSLDPRSYVSYGSSRFPAIEIRYQDALEYTVPERPDVVICTGGLHHLPRSMQPRFVTKVASELPPAGLFVVGEELIGAYRTEAERKRRALEMNLQLLDGLLDREAPAEVLDAACELLGNDLLERGEYKISMDELAALLAPHFTTEAIESFWPSGPTIGDVLLLARRR
jgi:SAM-dependent methyltransferase